jgi:hypothetical protein
MKPGYLIWLALAAAGCKSEPASQSASGTAAPAGSAASTAASARARSAKISPPPRIDVRGRPGDPPTAGGAEISETERAERRALRDERREERRQERMAQFDVNKDGTLSPEEMLASRKQRAEELRTRLDTNQDGRLSVEEFSIGPGRGRRDPLDVVDANQDGDVSADEIAQSMMKQREKMKQPEGDAPKPTAWGVPAKP